MTEKPSELAAVLAQAAQVEKFNRIGMSAWVAGRLWAAFNALSKKGRAGVRSEHITAALSDWQSSGGGELPPACLADRDCKALTVAWFMRQGILPPPDLAEFGADVLADLADGGWRGSKGNSELDRFRVLLVFVICVLGGLKPKRATTRIDAVLRKGERRAEASRGMIEGNSACDIAARVTGISYDHCLGVWKKRGEDEVQPSKDIEELSKKFWTHYRAERLGVEK